MNGVIKKKTDKGFGFIAVEGQQNELFFHKNSLIDISFDEIKEGDSVTFEVEQTQKGPGAKDVRKA